MKTEFRAAIVSPSLPTVGQIRTFVGRAGGKLDTFKSPGQFMDVRQHPHYDFLIVDEIQKNSLSGLEFLENAIRYRYVALSCKTLLLVDHIDDKSTSFILSVIRVKKPINEKPFLTLLNDHNSIIELIKPIVSALDEDDEFSFIENLKSVLGSKIKAAERDQIFSIWIKFLLKKGNTKQIQQLIAKLSSPEQRIFNVLNFAYLTGQPALVDKFLEKAECVDENRLFQYHLIAINVDKEEYDNSLEKLNKFGHVNFSATEIDLYALLLWKKSGISEALLFLDKVQKLTLENTQLKIITGLSTVRLTLIDAILTIEDQELRADVIENIADILSSISSSKNDIDYRRYMRLLKILVQIETDEQSHQKMYEVLKETEQSLAVNDVSAKFVLCYCYIRLEKREDVNRIIVSANQIIARMEISPLCLASQITLKEISDFLLAKNLINDYQIAKKLETSGYFYRSLRVLRSAVKRKKTVNGLLQMLSLMTKLDITSYYGISITGLKKTLASAKLSATQSKRFKDLNC